MSDPLKIVRKVFEAKGYKVIDVKSDKHLKITVQRPNGSTFIYVATRSPGDPTDQRRFIEKYLRQDNRRRGNG